MEMPTWLLSEVSLQAHRLLADAFAAAGTRGYHYRILATLEEFGPSSQAAIGRHARIDRSDVVATVGELVSGGYARRRRDPHDRRQNVIMITPAGLTRYRRLDQIVVGVQDTLLRPLNGRQRGVLTDLLRRLVAADGSPADASGRE
jgi:DNA-binding MarR family transcriptional regulator